MAIKISYRLFDHYAEDATKLFRLFEATHGTARSFEKRWNWEHIQHPNSQEIKVLVAEVGDEIVGTTTLLPVDIKIRETILSGCFHVDSMVSADFRRQGIMSNLLKYAATLKPVLYAKGTLEDQYRLRKKLGCKDVVPDTFFASRLSKPRSIWTKLFGEKLRIFRFHRLRTDRSLSPYNDFNPVKKFGKEFDEFWNRIAQRYSGIVVKNSPYMNWRYIDIPHRFYDVFYRKKHNRIVSLLVLNAADKHASIVDLLWDPAEEEEPVYSIKFAKNYCRNVDCYTLTCWATFKSLRDSLRMCDFHERDLTTNFTVYSDNDLISQLSEGNRIHFVHGDSDNEFADI